MQDTSFQYTQAQLSGLNDEQREALAVLAERFISEENPAEVMANMDDDDLSSTFNLLRPCDGSVPGEEVDCDLLGVIHRKFACFINAAVQMAEKHLGVTNKFWVVVDPDFEGYTRCVVVDFDNAKPWCSFNESTKAWHYEFETFADIAAEVLRIRDLLLKNLSAIQDFSKAVTGLVQAVEARI